jgi:hypothetical protein
VNSSSLAAPPGIDQFERGLLFARLQKGPPELLNLRPEAGLYKVVKSAPTILSLGSPNSLPRTATGVHWGRLKDNRPEMQFKLP